MSPLVGDWVEVRETEPGNGMVWEIEPRRSAFDRPAVANVDQLVVIASQAIPITDPFLIDRVAAIAALKGCHYEASAIENAIADIDLTACLGAITKDQLVSCILNQI